MPAALVGDRPVAPPHPDRADHVEHPGLVLEVEEGDAPGRARPLPVRDQPGDVHPAAGLGGRGVGDRLDPGRAQLVAQVLERVRARRDPGGPQVGHGDLDVVHVGQHRRRPGDPDPLEVLVGLGPAGVPQRLPARVTAGARRRRPRSPAPRAAARRARPAGTGRPGRRTAAPSRAATIRSATDRADPADRVQPEAYGVRRVAPVLRGRVGRARHPLGALGRRRRQESSPVGPGVTATSSRSAVARGQREVGPQHLDAVAAGVVDQRLRRVEPHRLGAQQRGQERAPGSAACTTSWRRRAWRRTARGSRRSRSSRRTGSAGRSRRPRSPTMPLARHPGVELLLDATRSARRRAWSPSPGAAGRPRRGCSRRAPAPCPSAAPGRAGTPRVRSSTGISSGWA